MADESTVLEVESTVVGPEPGTPERLAAKERIKLAYISGKDTLAHLSIVERIPYNTIQCWSANERWNEQKAAVTVQSHGKVVENISDFIAEERTKQVKRAILRSGAIQKAIDQSLKDEVTPADIQALASAEERMDNVIRRNLGMDQQSGGGSSVSINILAQGVSLS